ncbi:prostate and testis expressed protein 4 [Chionomys nivalis]|uniref:prostate and testis expressed protein 4 n=1 Tax=Chionomys nivalis TaxID=269649 RepID=UPI0025932D0C|nr:prostate and testis expressed protein 4 [Chionomys nivalis]
MNPATKVSTVLIVTLSFLCLAEGLICNVCDNAKESKCKRGQGRCVAHPGQSCATISYFLGSTHQFSRHLCMPDCRERELRQNGRLTYLMCCDKNLCNSF